MTSQDIKWLSNLWLRLTGTPFQLRTFVKKLRVAGGIEIRDMPDTHLFALFEGRFKDDWNEVGFVFSEMLARYAGMQQLGMHLEDEDLPIWAFSVFMVAEAAASGCIDLELQINKLLTSVILVREQLTPDETIFIFRKALCLDVV